MSTERKPWEIRKGDPTKPGATKTADGYNFTVTGKENESVELIFYKKGSEVPEQEIVIPDSYREGKVCSVVVKKQGLSLYEYIYRQGGKYFTDLNAGIFAGREVFGCKPEKDAVFRGKVLKEKPAEKLKERIPYEDMILYKVHVRGYTMQKNSRVRKKGTFAGLKEKIGYWKELGITSLELMPCYDFFEYPIQEEKREEKYKSLFRIRNISIIGGIRRADIMLPRRRIATVILRNRR